jgi:polyketide cyclase/dehydrase/lipid transport protein
MKWALIIGLVVIALIALVTIAGLALPKSHSASRRAAIASPCDPVFAAITDAEKFPSWRSDVRKVERLPDRDGRPVWVEEGRTGRMTLAVERLEPPRLVVMRIADPDLPFGGTWTYELTPTADGCQLTITENGEIYNPIFRFMARFVFGYESTMAGYLDAMIKKFGGRNLML